MNAFLLANLRGTRAFPSRRNLDENALAIGMPTFS